MEVKDFNALWSAMSAADPERTFSHDGENDGVSAYYDGAWMTVWSDGSIGATEDGFDVCLTPAMYPAIKAAIAEIERQNA